MFPAKTGAEVTAARYSEDTRILSALALALVDQPRASLQELAKAIGISKATLYRYSRTRDELIQRLMNHSIQVLDDAMARADIADSPPLEALRRLTTNHLEHRELSAFLLYYWKDSEMAPDEAAGWETKLDALFLRGQQAGVFRIDITAPALTEIWTFIVIGLMEAERRGRVARAGLVNVIEQAFLHGTKAAAAQ